MKKQSYQIDQSIKIEDTSKNSFVCLTNGKTVVSSISAKDKRELKLYFRELGKPLIFKLFTFSVLCVNVIIQAKVSKVTIDEEYTKHERQIKSFILQILRIESSKEPEISFRRVGKRARAHEAVYEAMLKKRQGIVVKAREVLRYYRKVNQA